MFNGKIALAIMAAIVFVAGICPAQPLDEDKELKKNWTEFLHYTVIGKPDLAKGYAQALLASNPDPEKLLELSKENPQGYQILLGAEENHDFQVYRAIIDNENRFLRLIFGAHSFSSG